MDPEGAWRSGVQPLAQVISSGEKGVGSLPGYLMWLLEHGAWREFQPPMGPVRRHATFDEFVQAKPLDGLGTTIETIIALLNSHPDVGRRTDALRALRAARKVGKPGPKIGKLDGDSPSNLDGTTTDYLVQRLHDQAPEQYERVTSGELSVNAAAIAAGFRPKRLSIRLDNPTSAVRSLLKHYTRDELLSALEAP